MTAVLPGADAQRWGFYASSVSADGRVRTATQIKFYPLERPEKAEAAAHWRTISGQPVTKHSIAVVGLLLFNPAMHATDRWASVSGNHSLHNTATSSGAVEPWFPTSECK